MSSFELPIYHLDNKQTIDKNIIDDLELLETNEDTDIRDSLLQTIYNPTSKIGKLNLKKHTEYFTSNKLFLKQTQKIITNWKIDDKIEEKQKYQLSSY